VKIALLLPGGVDRSGTHRVIPCLLWLIERLSASHEVHVFALAQEAEPGEWALLGARIHNAGGSRREMLRQLGAEHRRARFDAMHAFWAGSCGVVAAIARLTLGLPYVLHLPGGDVVRLPEIGYGGLLGWRGRMLTRVAVAGAARVVAPSDFAVARAAAVGIRAERLPYGVALDRWPPVPPRAREPDAPGRVVFVGSLNRVKDPGMLLRAAARLRETGVAFRLEVIGEDTLGGQVQQECAGLGLEGMVDFRGFLTQGEVRGRLEAADLLVVTSRHEAGPIVLLEAAAAGVPAVGTHVGHLAGWSPEAALTVEPGDDASLARAIAGVLGDEALRLRLARAAQARALAEDADFTARRVLQLSREISRSGR
jgi:glycosyltransferase involved in cell wall biosynthesis